MALMNAFELLGTESTLKKILKAVTYARDVSDQMRVVVSNSPQVLVHPRNDGTNGFNAAHTAWFAAGSVFSVDEREQQRVQSEQAFNQVRTQRWSFS